MKAVWSACHCWVSGGRRRGETGGGAEELLECGHEVAGGQAVQVEQGQHLADLRGLAAPRRQDRGGEPLVLAGGLVDALVVHPQRLHLDRSGRAPSRTISSSSEPPLGVVLSSLTTVSMGAPSRPTRQRRPCSMTYRSIHREGTPPSVRADPQVLSIARKPDLVHCVVFKPLRPEPREGVTKDEDPRRNWGRACARRLTVDTVTSARWRVRTWAHRGVPAVSDLPSRAGHGPLGSPRRCDIS